ncbi:MAG: alanine--glyoxylate aminotransferase family protein [Synergistaceae bacterium]|nr:alanine--glyoxylate aminotransferase family protein [Synergistaceae bacterium]
MMKTPKLVMIPGPTPVVRSIQAQMGRDTVAFGDKDFIADYKETVAELKGMWRCNGECFVISGSGTLAMEMAISNITQQGDNVLVCSHGFFGDRYTEIAQRKKLNTDTLKVKWGSAPTPELIDEELSKKNYNVVTVTHVDTATGAVVPLKDICSMLKSKHPEVMLIVDAVAAAGGVESYIEWGIDILFTCSQKCFGVAPGLVILWASDRAVQKRKSLPPIPESYVDFEKWIPVMNDPSKYWGTPSINLIWALKESVSIIKEEGITERYARHARQAAIIDAAMESIGFLNAAEVICRAPTLSVYLYPEGSNIVDIDFRTILAEEGVQAAGCLAEFAGKGFRMGHMGNIDKHTLVSAVAAVERTCFRCGYKIEFGKAVGVLQKGLAEEIGE